MNDLLILALLLGEPKHGYAIKKLAATLTGKDDLHNNLVYPGLRKFMKEGWVTSRAVSGQRGQTRDLYTLTAEGKAELRRRLAEFGPREAASLEAFRLRVGMFDLIAPEARLRILAARNARNAERRERLARLETVMTSLGATEWAFESARFAMGLLKLEQKWIADLQRKAAHPEPPKSARKRRNR